MTILDEINAHKKQELEIAKASTSVDKLQASEFYNRECLSLAQSIKSKNTAVIAEFKKKSPSKGVINSEVTIEEIVDQYWKAGAAGMSILTDFKYFGGTKEDVIQARRQNTQVPILRKDFILETYQLHEAKSWGADVVLLIAASLKSEEIHLLSKEAKALGLEVLLEVHNEEEIQSSPFDYIDIIGVNNRNLKNFKESNVNASLELFEMLPKEKVKISESCLSDPKTIVELKHVGFQGFLIGEAFMKTSNPGNALKHFMDQC